MAILQRNDILELPYLDPTYITQWGRLHGLEEINLSSAISRPRLSERKKDIKPSTSRSANKHQPNLPADCENPTPDTSALGPLT